MAQTTRCQFHALDTVLFHGSSDPVSAFIQKVESHFVVPSFSPRQRFQAPWTHAAILVDKNVLPLDCLEDGKLYVFESILSGRIFNLYHYCEVVPVDHQIDIRLGFWLGPQIREWVPLIDEVQANVAVFKLDERERERLLVNDIENTRKTLLAFYNAHKDMGYPLNPMPQFAAASPDLYARLKAIRSTAEEILSKLPGALEWYHKPAQEIFCSEMVAKLYESLLVETFHESKPPKQGKFKHYTEYTPLDLEGSEILKGASETSALYAKLNGKSLLDLETDSTGHQVLPASEEFQLKSFPYKKLSKDHWFPVKDGILPTNALPGGYSEDGKSLYISRALIGQMMQVGYTNSDGVMKANFEGNELTIQFDHEVLCLSDTSDFEWIPSGTTFGTVPMKALQGGCDSSGNPLYIARCRLADSKATGLGSLIIGPVSVFNGGAKFAFGGKEITKIGDYEVLCQKSHFLERLWFTYGATRFNSLLFAVFFYILGTFGAMHFAVLAFTVYFLLI